MKLPTFKARTIAGAGIFFQSTMVFAMIYFKPELAKDDLFKMLAQAVVVQGLIGLAMAYWFTANSSREHQADATGKPDDPVHVKED